MVLGLILLGFGTQPIESQTTAPCTPFVTTTINGQSAHAFAPPLGRTSNSELAFSVDAGFAGDCDDALNRPPVLLGGWVDPSLTRVASSFEYHVTYVDLDNDPPSTITATLDGRKTHPMTPSDPLDTDYRDGAEFTAFFGNEFVDDTLIPAAMEGDHSSVLQAHDGRAAATPLTVAGPRLRETVSGSLLFPNPTNRLLIHPIANGPTFNPQSEVMPPAGLLLPEGDGIYSATFPIDPDAGAMGARWSVGTAAALRLRGFGLLEGTPGNEFVLGGAAQVDPRAHAGAQSVDLAPEGTLPDAAGRYGSVEIFPNSDTFRFALVGGIRFSLSQPDGSSLDPVRIAVWMDLDPDRDDVTDVCVGTEIDVAPGAEWWRVVFDPSTPMNMYDMGCTREATPPDLEDGVTTLDDIQDIAAWGISPIRAVRIEALGSGVSSGATLVDSVLLVTGSPNTNGDVDACIYGPSAPLPASPLQPMLCVSDIGPNSGPVPVGATHANVWADQMTPFLSTDTLVPKRPYLEPLTYSFGYANNPNAGPAFELPPPTTGRLFLVEDQDGDGVADDDEAMLWEQGGIILGDAAVAGFTLPFDRIDGTYRFVLVYESGRPGETASMSLAVQRFVNDLPAAALSVTMLKTRIAIFQLFASDADEQQTETSQRLGGLQRWTLDFGDGTSASGTFPMPSTVEHRYKPGEYHAILSMVDADGATATATVGVSNRRQP